MSPQPLFRFERHGRGRWRVYRGSRFVAGLAREPNSAVWRLRTRSGPSRIEASWPAGPGAGSSYRLPAHIEAHAIKQIAAWALDSRLEFGGAVNQLRVRLESSTHQLELQRDIHRRVALRDSGHLTYEERKTVDADLASEIKANREALARTHTRDIEEEASA